MVRDTVRVLLSGIALSLALTPSFAQSSTPLTVEPHKRFALTASGFIPFSGKAVTLGGPTYTGIAFSYSPSSTGLGLRADYYRGQSTRGEVSLAGISPTYQVNGARLRGNQLHYGIGLGFFSSYAKDTEAEESASGFGLGGRVYVGMKFTSNILAEISYTDLPGKLGTHPRGFALNLGTRF